VQQVTNVQQNGMAKLSVMDVNAMNVNPFFQMNTGENIYTISF
jgi:hypothetical protein